MLIFALSFILHTEQIDGSKDKQISGHFGLL